VQQVSRARHGRSARRCRRRPALLGLLLLVLAWGGWHGVQGARDLRAAGQALDGAREAADGGSLELGELRRSAELARSARDHLRDPVLRALGAVPALGVPRETAAGSAAAVDLAVSAALLPLVTQLGPTPSERLTAGPGSIDVALLADLAGPSGRARLSVQRAAAGLERTPARTGVTALDEGRAELLSGLQQLERGLGDLALAAEVGPRLLGADRPRRYLLVSQSPAEARGTGGLIGGYSLLEAAQGSLRIVRSGPRSELASPRTPAVDLGPEFTEHYGGDGAAGFWVNSNVGPHFPDAARIWLALWQRQYGERLDGALVVDPVALSYLLEGTGAVGLPGGEQVTAANVVDLTMRDVYARYTEDAPRDAFLQQISTAVAGAITTREPDGRALARGLARAVRERRLLLYAAEPQLQARLAPEPISGALPQGRVVGDVLVDQAGSKLDYYLDRTASYTAHCDGRSALRLTLHNDAPPRGLPAYVTPAAFRPGLPPGTNLLRTTLYLPSGSVLTRLTVDGAVPATFRQGTEQGLVWVEVPVVLGPGQSLVVAADLEEQPAPRPAVVRLAQPLVRPERFHITDCTSPR
jgi:hypothetical protein